MLDVTFPGRRRSVRPQERTTEDGRDGLEKMTRMVAEFKCQRPPDKVYGIVLLVDWDGRPPIQADYGKPRYALALEVLRLGWESGQYDTLFDTMALARSFILHLSDADVANAVSDVPSPDVADGLAEKRDAPWSHGQLRKVDKRPGSSCKLGARLSNSDRWYIDYREPREAQNSSVRRSDDVADSKSSPWNVPANQFHVNYVPSMICCGKVRDGTGSRTSVGFKCWSGTQRERQGQLRHFRSSSLLARRAHTTHG